MRHLGSMPVSDRHLDLQSGAAIGDQALAAVDHQLPEATASESSWISLS
jgi:hypothetical protein